MSLRSVSKWIPCLFLLAIAGQAWFSPAVEAQEPRWYPYVLARGQDRATIQSPPIVDRPYRPMHFYGNTVRRMHHRGTPAPRPRDFARATAAVIRRR